MYLTVTDKAVRYLVRVIFRQFMVLKDDFMCILYPSKKFLTANNHKPVLYTSQMFT